MWSDPDNPHDPVNPLSMDRLLSQSESWKRIKRVKRHALALGQWILIDHDPYRCKCYPTSLFTVSGRLYESQHYRLLTAHQRSPQRPIKSSKEWWFNSYSLCQWWIGPHWTTFTSILLTQKRLFFASFFSCVFVILGSLFTNLLRMSFVP